MVDDDIDLVKLVAHILKEKGYLVAKAYDGNSALELAKKTMSRIQYAAPSSTDSSF